MSKPIRVTQEFVKMILPEILEEIGKKNMMNGTLKYEKKLSWKGNDRAKIIFDAEAYWKMKILVANTNDEVAWHGVCTRDEKTPSVFHISDIMVYPQTVTGGTVNTDQAEYQNWLMAFDDDVFNNIRMQGHSHVNMGTYPSITDTTHQERVLDMFTDADVGGVMSDPDSIPDNRFYVFMIWNKKDEKFINIFDLKYNTLYETDDVDLEISGECEIGKFLDEAAGKVKKEVKTYSYGGYGYQYSGRGTYIPDKEKKTKPSGTCTNKKSDKNSKGNRWQHNVYDYEDYDDDYPCYYSGR